MKYLLLLPLIVLCSCKKENLNTKNGHAILVGYKVSDSSNVWVELVETKKTYKLEGVRDRKVPRFNLGDTLKVKYLDSPYVHIFANYKDFSCDTDDLSTRKVALPGYYEYLF